MKGLVSIMKYFVVLVLSICFNIYSLCDTCISPLGQFKGEIQSSSYSCVGASFNLPYTENICCVVDLNPLPKVQNMTKWEFFKEIFENSGDQQRTEYLYAHTDNALSIVLLNSPLDKRCRIKAAFLAIAAAETNGYQTFDSLVFDNIFKPRGILRVRNSTSYTTISKLTNIDYIKTPEKMIFPSDAIKSNAKFWEAHGLSVAVENGYEYDYKYVVNYLIIMNGQGSSVTWEEKLRRLSISNKALKCIW